MIPENHTTALLLTVLVVSAVLAGCASGPEGDASGLLVEFENQGGILGVVLDDQQLPIANATVYIGDEERGKSNDTGHFRIAPVDPGRHGVWAAKENYHDGRVDVNVVEGQLATVMIVLEFLPGKAPYHEVLIGSGVIQCGFAITDPVRFQNDHLAACAAPEAFAGVSTGDEFATFFDMGDGFDGGQTGFWGETEWDSTQLLGRGMKVNWWITEEPVAEDVDNAPRAFLGRFVGLSPVQARIAAGPFVDAERAVCVETASCFAMATHYPSANNTNAPVDVGFVLNQQYSDYYTAFFNAPVPVEYSSLPDN